VGLIAIAPAVYGMLRFVLGPLPQDPSYHILADTRRCGPIPRAGDVLTKGADDLRLYLIVRIGTDVAIACLLLLRRGRHSGAAWLWAALALDVAMTVVERLDNEIYSATGMLVSGHNVKHVLASVLLGCTLAWLLLREPSSPSGDRPQLF
jgi:hypothetical protein